jgi:hypothetical protein
MAHVEPAEEKHIAELLNIGLRAEDAEEIFAYGGTPERMLGESLRNSTLAWAIMDDGRCIGMFGVGAKNTLSPVGVPWLLGSDGIKKIWLQFLKQCRFYLDVMNDIYPVLENWVDARYETSLKWAKWLGFTVDDPAPYGMLGRPFCRIERRRG